MATAVITPSAAVAAASRKAAAPVDDRELVRRAQAEDQAAFEELVRRHQHRVLLRSPAGFYGSAKMWKTSRNKFS